MDVPGARAAERQTPPPDGDSSIGPEGVPDQARKGRESGSVDPVCRTPRKLSHVKVRFLADLSFNQKSPGVS